MRNIRYNIKLIFIVVFSLGITACVTTPRPLYVEPDGSDTARLVILNKTLRTEMFNLYMYENNKNCTNASAYIFDGQTGDKNKHKRKKISIKIPANKEFTFKVRTFVGSGDCYVGGTFLAKKNATYVATMKNHGYCKVELERKTKSDQLVPEKSYVSLWAVGKPRPEGYCLGIKR